MVFEATGVLAIPGVRATEIFGERFFSGAFFFGTSVFVTGVVVFGCKLLALVGALSSLCFLKYVCASSLV